MGTRKISVNSSNSIHECSMNVGIFSKPVVKYHVFSRELGWSLSTNACCLRHINSCCCKHSRCDTTQQ